MDRDVSQGIDIQEVIGAVATDYIRKALECGQNKT